MHGADTTAQQGEAPWRYLPERVAAGLMRVPGPGPETVRPDGRHGASCASGAFD